MKRIRTLIMGAAGRDFHNFNLVFRKDATYEVVAFTATQIPNIEGRVYPPELAGDLYPKGIPIHPEEELADLIDRYKIDHVVFSYSDVSHEYVMHKAAEVVAAGADFRFIGARSTMLKSRVPVISVCAVRTGCGKSAATRKVSSLLKSKGRRVVVVRHPMPYGDLAKQQAQHFATLEDLKKYNCTIEEMEEYEPHIMNGVAVYAGVDYEKVLTEAEKEAEIIVWDGGNNDLPFFKPDLEIVLVDPHRPNHELRYFPGEANFRRAGVIVISKIDTAKSDNVKIVRENIRRVNPKALIIEAALPFTVEGAEHICGRRVLVIEDGPTVTHGEMRYGAGMLAAERFGAAEIVDPRPYLVGSLAEAFEQYPFIGKLLPSIGYGEEQIKDLETTINRTPCDIVLFATPIDLRRVVRIGPPAYRVTYEMQEIGKPSLEEALKNFYTLNGH